jgi:hypothetical protein
LGETKNTGNYVNQLHEEDTYHRNDNGVLLELLLLVENEEVVLSEQVGVSHPIELEVYYKSNPLDGGSSSFKSSHPSVETFISNVFLFSELLHMRIPFEMVSNHKSYPVLFGFDILLTLHWW